MESHRVNSIIINNIGEKPTVVTLSVHQNRSRLLVIIQSFCIFVFYREIKLKIGFGVGISKSV